MYIKVSLIHDIQVLIYRGSTNERLSGEGVAYDSYYSETDRVIPDLQTCMLTFLIKAEFLNTTKCYNVK